MKRFLPAAAAAALVFAAADALHYGWPAAAAGGEMTGVASIYSLAAGAVRDTNGDGLADSVAARVILPADPVIEDIEAAANIAGRLGFGPPALSLPLVLRAPDLTQPADVAVPILVGRSNPHIVRLA